MPRPKAFSEHQVLTQSMLCFWRRGYTATSMKHLEAATNLKPSSIYNSFGSKDELFRASLEHYFKEVMSVRIETYLVLSDNPIEGIRMFFSDCFVRDADVIGMGCFMVNTSTELGPHQASVRSLVRQSFKSVERGLITALERAKSEQILDSTVDVPRRARHLGLLLNGMLVQSQIEAKSHWLDESMDTLESLLH